MSKRELWNYFIKLCLLNLILVVFYACTVFNYKTKVQDAVYQFTSSMHITDDNFSYQIIDTLQDGLIFTQLFSKDSILLSSFYINSKNELVGEYKKWYNSGKIKEIRNYSNDGALTGEYKYYYENGQIKQIYNNLNAKINGVLKTFYENGNKRRVDYYTNNKLDSGTCWDNQGNIVNHKEFTREPFVNLDYLVKNLVFPEKLQKEGIQEQILIKVFLSSKGEPIYFKYDSNHSKEFITEIARCLKLPKIFKPLFHEDVPVDCYVSIPITFRFRD